MKRFQQLCTVVILLLAVLPFTEPFCVLDPNFVGEVSTASAADYDAMGNVLAQPNLIRSGRARVVFAALPLPLIVAKTVRHTQFVFVSLSEPLSDSVSTRCPILRV